MTVCVWLTFFLAVTVFGPSTALDEENIYIAQKIMLAYEKLLTYVNQYAAVMTVDTMFGVILAEAQLEMMSELPIIRNILSDITTLKWRTHYVVDIMKSYTSVGKGIPETKYRLTDYRIWLTNDVSMCDNKISQLGPLTWNISELMPSLINGMPDENFSDTCIVNLIQSGPFDILHECDFESDGCAEVYEDIKASNGYRLTHKVLYWQIAKAINCTLSGVVDENIQKLCTRIYAEAKNNEENGFPILAKDLFMEQVAICGREGYTEFLNKKWVDIILNWQSNSGCYAFPHPVRWRDKRQSLRTLSHIRSERRTNTNNLRCDAHMTGVAAVALVTMLRNFVTEPEWSACPPNIILHEAV